MSFHPRNRHQGQYDLDALKKTTPEFSKYVIKNKYGNDSIDFADPDSVRALNQALLFYYYGLKYWSIPKTALCPPIPGRADYIHVLADLISKSGEVKILDVGVGANCIYPILGVHEYGWNFVGSDIHSDALDSARLIVSQNQSLSNQVELRLQSSPDHIFEGIIKNDDRFTATICNPPFHSSLEEAQAGTRRKLGNLAKGKNFVPKKGAPLLNFGGEGSELWCEGGELQFIRKMINESVRFKNQCVWFTSLVSKVENIQKLERNLQSVNVKDLRLVDLSQGQKKSRIIAWTF